jgi:hypothetical protein
VLAAQADGPLVGWLEALAPVGALAYVSALDRELLAASHIAAMAPDPCSVRRTAAARDRAADALNAARQADASYGPHSRSAWRQESSSHA